MSCYQRTSHLAWRRLDDEILVVNLQSKRMFALNESAGAIWELVGQPVSMPLLAAGLASSAGDENRGEQLNDVAAFFAELEERGLVTRVEGPPSNEGSGCLEQLRLRSSTQPFARPRITWEESISNFGASCMEIAFSGNPNCEASPVV